MESSYRDHGITIFQPSVLLNNVSCPFPSLVCIYSLQPKNPLCVCYFFRSHLLPHECGVQRYRTYPIPFPDVLDFFPSNTIQCFYEDNLNITLTVGSFHLHRLPSHQLTPGGLV